MTDEIKQLISSLMDFKNDIAAMDNKVRLYVSDRKKYPHPNHEPLIEKIRKFENHIHTVRNTEVQLRLDSLMLSLMIHEKHWKRLFDENAKKEQETNPHNQTDSSAANSTDNRLIDQLYDLSKKKWDDYQVEKTESKEEMAKRILPAYNKAKKNLQENEKIKFYYDVKRCCIDLKMVKIQRQG